VIPYRSVPVVKFEAVTLLNRLLRPWFVYTELTLSLLLIFVGLGQKLWGGGGPNASAAGAEASGNFIMLLGAAFLVMSLMLLTAMVWRRRRR
jgi:hypothetical protein